MVFKIKGVQEEFLTSSVIYQRLSDKNDIFEKINALIDFTFIYEEVKDAYCEDNGRPPHDPVMLFKACLVQRLKGLSDTDMEQVARYDIRVKRFLGLPIDDFGFDHSTLSVFRKRLGPDRFEKIFQKILIQIRDKGIIKDPTHQYIDSMAVIAHAALPSTTTLVYQGIRKVVEELECEERKKVCGMLELTEEKLIAYSKPHTWFQMEEEKKKASFGKAVTRAKTLIAYLEQQGKGGEGLTLLKQILSENANIENEQIQTEKAIKTLVDPDAKLSHKSKEKLIFGYKCHASVTQEGIVTAVEVTSAAEKDDKQIETLFDKQEEVNLKPKEADTDAGYGYIETIKKAQEKGVILNAPLRGMSKKEISVYDLLYDPETNMLTCLNNITVKGIGKDGLTFEFPLKVCRNCPFASECPLPRSRRIKFHPDHEIARDAIRRQREKEAERKAAKMAGIKLPGRWIIENVFAYFEKLGGKKTPYIGLARTKIHILLVATLSNIMKAVRLAS